MASAIACCMWGYVLQQYVRSLWFSYDPVAENTMYRFMGNILSQQPARPSARLAATAPQIHTVVAPPWARHISCVSCPTEIFPIQQVMTQVPPQLLRKLLASSPAPGFLSRPDLPAAVALNSKPATSRLTRKN